MQGRDYPNRSDMQLGARVPVARIPGQEYGVQAEQVRAQQQLPVRGQPAPVVAPSSSSSFSPTVPIPLGAPTQRPNEPVTAGAAMGPGPGPVTGGAPAVVSPDTSIGQTVAALAAASDSPELAQLADFVASGRA